MFHYNTPEEYVSGLKDHYMEAFKCHYSSPDSEKNCSHCPFGPKGSTHEPCLNIFAQYLPDNLRYYADEHSLEYAEKLDQCCKKDYKTCSLCMYFKDCYPENDLSYIMKDVYNHFCWLWINTKKYNRFNYIDTWFGYLFYVLIGLVIYHAAKIFLHHQLNIIYTILLVFLSLLSICGIYHWASECIKSGRKKAAYFDSHYIIGREKPYPVRIRR